MLGTDEAFAGPAVLAELVRNKEVKPRELVELYLGRIESLDPRLNAFRTTMPEQALAEADALAAPGGPLAGVPIAVKDDIAVGGQAVTKGSRSYGAPAPADAEAVRRLRAAGAIPVGITNVPELTIWPWTVSEANGITRNPWDPSRTPGGSSGGSAAAVASGMVPAATGSDGGGSIRIPAACCGLVGMKPTRGRVSPRPLRDGWLGLSVYGALARTVKDSALLLDVMHGAVPGDVFQAPAPAGSFAAAAESPPQSLKIAVSRKVPPGFTARLSAEQRGAWERMAMALGELEHDVTERDPAYGMASLEFTRTFLRGIYEDSLTVPDRSRLETLSRRMATAGRFVVPERQRASLLSKHEATTRRILALWAEVDVLMTPGLSRTALPAEGGFGRPLPLAFTLAASFTPWTPLFNLTGQPGITIPAGTASDGLPLSVQLVGRPGAEEMLYSLAAQLEEAQPWAERRPPIS